MTEGQKLRIKKGAPGRATYQVTPRSDAAQPRRKANIGDSCLIGYGDNTDFYAMSRKNLLPDAGPVLDLHQAVYASARDFRGGLTAIAAMMAVNYDTLQKKISVGNHTHHLTLGEFQELATITDDPRIDEAYARSRGKNIFKPLPVAATAEALHALGDLLMSEGRFVASLHEGVADDVWEEREVLDLEHHGYKVICEILGIMAGARQAMEGRNDG